VTGQRRALAGKSGQRADAARRREVGLCVRLGSPPVEELAPSERDKNAPLLSEIAAELPFVYL
jgi:hypothetical protein